MCSIAACGTGLWVLWLGVTLGGVVWNLIYRTLGTGHLLRGRGGGYKTGGWGTCEVPPLWKGVGGGGGAEFFLSHAEGGAQNVLGSFYAVACSFSHIEGGGDSLKIKWGGGAKRFNLVRDFPIL